MSRPGPAPRVAIEGPWYPVEISNQPGTGLFGDEAVASIPVRSPLVPNVLYEVEGAPRAPAFAFSRHVVPHCRANPVACLDVAARSRFLLHGAQPLLGAKTL
jgi:hypothetical protein